jgi:hypothetical protein
VALAASLAAPPLAAQGLPPYLSLNPVVTSRSGVYFQPFVDPARQWDFRILTDYGSAIEYAFRPTAQLLLDAELLRVEATAIRNLGRGFLGVSASFNGAYDGFLDGFLDWYHDLTGLRVAAREERPRNEFAYALRLPNGDSLTRAPSGGFAGDLRLLGGIRLSRRWQTAVAVTLPTGPEGYGRKVPSVSSLTTFKADLDHRWRTELGLGVGFTQRHGALRDFQRTAFLGGSAGVRYRFWGRQAAFVNLFYQSAGYRETGLRAFDKRELTLDYGFLLRAKRGPEWFLGMTEDLEPRGPAIDLSFRIGARW